MIEYYTYEISLDVFYSGKGFYLYRVNHTTKMVHFIADGNTENRKIFMSILEILLQIQNQHTWIRSGISYESFLSQKNRFNIIDLNLEA